MSEQNNNIEPRTDWAWCYENPRLAAAAIDELQDQLNELASQSAAPIPEQVAQASGIEGLTRYGLVTWSANIRETENGEYVKLSDVERLLATQSAKQGARPNDDHLWDETLRDRDTYHEWADKLAEAIAAHFGAEIGEHSNMNCPWTEALDVIKSAPPVAQEVTQQAAKAETAERANVLPPTRGTGSRHPIQPLGPDEHGRIRFKRNAIVDFLTTNRLNELSAMDFPQEDWEQLAQLIGYSLDGFGTLSYVTDETYEAAAAMLDQTLPAGSAREGGNTNTESSDLAPTTSTVSAPGALVAPDDVRNQALDEAASIHDAELAGQGFSAFSTANWHRTYAKRIRALKRTAAQAATDKSED